MTKDKFKVGDLVVTIKCFNPYLPKAHVSTIKDFFFTGECTYIILDNNLPNNQDLAYPEHWFMPYDKAFNNKLTELINE